MVAMVGAPLHAGSLGDAFLALYGIAVYAFIASGLGILGTDVMETEQRMRVKLATVYLYMLLAAMYAKIFFTVSVWGRLAQLILSSLFTFALWQKVRDLCPYLLDPTDRPPRTIGLADGMIAALAFFVVQGLAMLVVPEGIASRPSAQITIAYIFAGLSVASGVLFVFWQQGIPSLWRSFGLIAVDRRGEYTAARQALTEGAIWGGIAALGAVLYFQILGLFPEWQVWKQEAELHSFLAPGSQPFWIWILLVCAAPVFEEFLFRGLVFQGLRRSTRPILAIVGSAALFALVHPPIAVIPVFGLGVATAISFNRSGLLLAPIVVHAIYNGSVLMLNRL
jgi:membrane protease YdiL (CAAX protease family)